MSDHHYIGNLWFHPASQFPDKADDGNDFLLFNVCDGYRIGMWDHESQEFWGWYGGTRKYGMAYNAWARLPDGVKDEMQAFREYSHLPGGIGESG